MVVLGMRWELGRLGMALSWAQGGFEDAHGLGGAVVGDDEGEGMVTDWV